MGVQLLTTIARYQGYSWDDKPTGVAIGSTFLEMDSGLTWVYAGGGWSQVEGAVGSTFVVEQALSAILDELRRIRRGVELMIEEDIDAS